MNDQTRTTGTDEAYVRRARQLIAVAAKALRMLPERTTPIQVARHLCAKSPELSAATWRQYRAALRHFWMIHPAESAGDALAALESQTIHRSPKAKRRTSGGKAKSLSDSDLNRIERWLTVNGGKWQAATRAWLRAGRLVGLRPCEWQRARILQQSDQEPALLIMNAKTTNRRANGIARQINLVGLQSREFALLRNFIAFMHGIGVLAKHDQAYNGCRRELHRAVRAIWPLRERRVTLYSARHQFSADAKRAGLSRREVAALMGHGSDKTATTHYGKRRSGRAGFSLRAAALALAGVRSSKGNSHTPTTSANRHEAHARYPQSNSLCPSRL